MKGQCQADSGAISTALQQREGKPGSKSVAAASPRHLGQN